MDINYFRKIAQAKYEGYTYTLLEVSENDKNISNNDLYLNDSTQGLCDKTEVRATVRS